MHATLIKLKGLRVGITSVQGFKPVNMAFYCTTGYSYIYLVYLPIKASKFRTSIVVR